MNSRNNRTGDDQGVGPRRVNTPAITRATFLNRLAVGTCFGSLLLSVLGAIRFVIPSLLPGPMRTFKIGRPEDYNPGMTRLFEDEKVLVFCDKRGLYAISLVCTHLGCVVHHERSGLRCPCHGSAYRLNGDVVRGPAPKPLPWLAISLLPGGDLAVDRSTTVKPGTKFALRKGMLPQTPPHEGA